MRLSVVALLSLTACGSGLNDNRFPTGSDSIAATAKYDAVVAVNTDEGTISRVDLATDKVKELLVGAEPTRIARAGDRFFVTLRGERAIAVISADFEVEKMIKTGAEPFGVVATENGKRVYVAVSQAGYVVEIDADKLEKMRTFKVDNEPRWLALHPSNKSLFVGSAYEGRVTRIDLRNGKRERVELPETTRTIDFDDSTVDLTVRVTGDPAVTPDGKRLVVPVVYVDNNTPVEEPVEGRPVKNGYGADGMSLGRINPSVVRIPLGRGGQIDDEEEPIAIFIGAFLEDNLVRSYPSSVTPAPDSNRVAVTMEASDAVIVVNLDPFKNQGDSPNANGSEGHSKGFEGTDVTGTFHDTGFVGEDREGGGSAVPQTLPGEGGFYERPVVAIPTESRGPLGIVFTSEDDAYVHTFIDRQVSDLNWSAADEVVSDLARDRFANDEFLEATQAVQIAESSLSPEVEAGRSLFFSAVDGRMASNGAGVSCSTCHLGGRTDGLTWQFEQGPRQTPSLAGVVSGTAPVTWANDVASVADEAMLTTELRMGGKKLQHGTANEIGAYVDWSRDVDVEFKGSDDKSVARGREIFNRADTACGTCHGGDQFTDNSSHALFGSTAMNTPTLIGIAATAPYLHDGSAATLADVLTLSWAGQMGDTSKLSKGELLDLENYLLSL